MAVDERYWGLWERLSLADATGIDCTTRVCWLQVGEFYGDLRVPWPRPVFTGQRLRRNSTAPVCAEPLVLERMAEQGAPLRNALLLAVGDWFIYACARTAPLPQAASLAHLAAMAQPLCALADCEISFGLRRGPAAWRIALSTLPFREGQPLFADGEWPGTPQGGESTQHIRGIMRRWRVHAWNAGFPETRSV